VHRHSGQKEDAIARSNHSDPAMTHARSMLGSFILFTVVLVLVVMAVEALFFEQSAQKVALSNALAKAKEREGVLNTFATDAKNHLDALSHSRFLNDYLADPGQKPALEEFFTILLAANTHLMQLRFIDASGKEQVRVDRVEGGSHVVPPEALQDKSGRYYFTHAAALPPGSTWFSAIDLNIEHGRVERPFKPVMRITRTLDADGRFGGMLIINVCVKSLLNALFKAPLYDMILTNGKGDTIRHYAHKMGDHSKCWGNSLENGYNIASEFPGYADELLKQPELHSEHFVSRHLDVPIHDGLILILQLNKTYLEQQEKRSLIQYITVALILTVMLSLFGYYILTHFRNKLVTISELSALNERLKSTELSRNIALKTAKMGIWEWDFQSDTLTWDDQMYHIYGRSHEDDNPPFALWSSSLAPDEADKAQAALMKAVDEGSDFDTWFEIVTPGGEHRFIKAYGVTVYDDKRNPAKMVGTNLDITELHTMKEREKESERMLLEQSKLAAMGEMVGAIAHQWRQPLNELAIRIQKVKRDFGKARVDETYVNELVSASKQTIRFMSQTIDNFRNFFRIDKQTTRFDVPEAVDEVIHMLQAQLKDHHITIDSQMQSFTTQGHRSEFQQAIINLINNAKDALVGNQTESPCIEVSAKQGNITIKDNGGGIPDEIINRVFEPYFTTKDQGEGTGMGLYLTRMIIEKNMHGTINAYNSGGGAVFEIHLSEG
jgi:signal transduction histidine kinase